MKKNAREPSKKRREFGQKQRKVIFGIVLPLLIIVVSAVLAWIFILDGVFGQADIQSVVDNSENVVFGDLSIAVDKPVAETQEISIEKRIEKEKQAAEARKKAQEALDKLTKELQVKQAREDALNKVCFIGDSITTWGGADNTIANLGGDFSGINLGRPGSSASDWLGTIASDINNCRKPNLKAAMIMLGTNDALRGVSAQSYLASMASLIATIRSLGVPVIVNCPIQLGGHEAVFQYCAGLGANGISNPLNLPLSDGIHPTGDGYAALGSAWANAYLRVLGLGGTPEPVVPTPPTVPETPTTPKVPTTPTEPPAGEPGGQI